MIFIVELLRHGTDGRSDGRQWKIKQPLGLPSGIASGNGRIEATEVDVATMQQRRAGAVLVKEGGIYAMSKSALQGLVQGLSRDLGPRGITINTVQPGPVDAEMNPATGPFAETLKGMMALPRYGTVEEIAGMVADLASEEAAYTMGANLMIDGGFRA